MECLVICQGAVILDLAEDKKVLLKGSRLSCSNCLIIICINTNGPAIVGVFVAERLKAGE